MCRNPKTQLRLIESEKGRSIARKVHALYARTDYGDDLIALVVEDPECATLIKEVDEVTDEPVTRVIRELTFNVTKFNVLNVLHLVDDYEKQKGFYRLAMC